MNKSQLFFPYRESSTLHSIIKSITQTTDYIQKLNIYIHAKATNFIKFHNKYLDFKECQIFTIPQLNNYIFAILYTKTNINHPYLLYFNLDDIIITFLIPFGGDYKQVDYITYMNAIPETNYIERTAIYILIEKSILIRKIGIVDSRQFSLINCTNITNCIKKMREIDKMRISQIEKTEQKAKYSDYYLNKAIDFLKYYFVLLEQQNFNEAMLFLKGGDAGHFGKQRLNTFFKNTKPIIGHLEIFISLYQLFHYTKSSLLLQ